VLWRGNERGEGSGRYLTRAGRCTVHQVRAPTEKRRQQAVGREGRCWGRVCEAVPRLGGLCTSRSETGRKEATGRAACQVLDEKTGRLATLCSVGGLGRGPRRVSEAMSGRVRAFGASRATRGGRWGGRRGRVEADVPAGHRGSPWRVREREVEGDVRAGSGRERVQGNVPQDKQIRPRGRRDGDLQKSLHARVPM
jgi:hypothetical protein